MNAQDAACHHLIGQPAPGWVRYDILIYMLIFYEYFLTSLWISTSIQDTVHGYCMANSTGIFALECWVRQI